jgi:SAM-dependent methyltransferase
VGPETFDLVTANMVVEHLEEPEAAFSEIRRILKPKGVFLFHTPNARHYLVKTAALVPQWLKTPLIQVLEGRREDDVYPTRYRANTPETIRALAARSGFQVELLAAVCSSAVSAILGPLAVAELLATRWLTTAKMENYRSNLIVALRKP